MNYAAMAQTLRSERRLLLGASAKLGDVESAITLAMLQIIDVANESQRRAIEFAQAMIEGAKVVAKLCQVLNEAQRAPKFPSGGIRSRLGRAAEYIVPKHLRR